MHFWGKIGYFLQNWCLAAPMETGDSTRCDPETACIQTWHAKSRTTKSIPGLYNNKKILELLPFGFLNAKNYFPKYKGLYNSWAIWFILLLNFVRKSDFYFAHQVKYFDTISMSKTAKNLPEVLRSLWIFLVIRTPNSASGSLKSRYSKNCLCINVVNVGGRLSPKSIGIEDVTEDL